MPDQNCLTWSTQSCTFWFELLAGAAETVTATRSTAMVVSTREVLILRTFVREGKEEARSEARLSMSVGNGHARGRISVFHAGPKKDRKRQAEGRPGRSAVRGTHVGGCRTVLASDQRGGGDTCAAISDHTCLPPRMGRNLSPPTHEQVTRAERRAGHPGVSFMPWRR